MLINLSNHPSSQWDKKQREAAAKFGEVVDLPFPAIDPEWDSVQIEILSSAYKQKIEQMANGESCTVHIMGELTFCFSLVVLLQQVGITCVASTTHRQSEVKENKKISVFAFSQFRAYRKI